jgi:SAM-dependent methyltransferase
LRVTEFLHDDEIAGFMQSEQGPDGRLFCPEAHGVYHWVPGSPRRRGPYVFAIYSNHHAACYMLSRRQLKRAIESGGFDVGPHEERYDLLVSAATDPYVQCGLTKLICISHVDDFIVSHLPNRYLDYGMEYSELRLQINEMLTGDHNGTSHAELMQTETRLPKMPFSKNYYEPVRNEFLQLMPKTARNVLSIGCGSGKTEQRVMETGRAVFGIPLDRVIGAVARSKGVRVSEPNLETALREMGDQRFDCVLCDWILHLWPEPSSLLKWISDRMSSDGVLLAVVPNLNHFRPLWRRWRGRSGYQDLGDYDRAGLHKATRRQLRAWLKNAGFKVDRMTTIVPDHHQTMSRLAGPLGTELFATQIVVRARRG